MHHGGGSIREERWIAMKEWLEAEDAGEDIEKISMNQMLRSKRIEC
jgi:hypothetical protein